MPLPRINRTGSGRGTGKKQEPNSSALAWMDVTLVCAQIESDALALRSVRTATDARGQALTQPPQPIQLRSVYRGSGAAGCFTGFLRNLAMPLTRQRTASCRLSCCLTI
jgi:hypothetical protein